MSEVLSNAEFAGDVRTSWSRSGVVSVYADSGFACSSQLQRSVALSKTEAEFFAASERAKGPLWLKCLFVEVCLRNLKSYMFRVNIYYF
jgi:hypothetical protein